MATTPNRGPLLIASLLQSVADPLGATGYVANRPTRGPSLDSYPRSAAWGSPSCKGLCSHVAHLWATSNFVSHFEALGTPQTAGVM